MTQVPERIQDVEFYAEDHTRVINEAPPGLLPELAPATKGRPLPGRGPPRMAEFMGTAKPFADGGGLCSPGRWAPEKRHSKDRGLYGLRDLLYAHYVKGLEVSTLSARDFAIRLAACRVTECPFDAQHLDAARSIIADFLCLGPSSTSATAGQVLRLDLIRGLLTKVGDPDAPLFEDLRHGVPLGVDMQMPRTPDVFEEKAKWKLEETDGPGEPERANYGTLGDHIQEVKTLFKEEAKLGWMREYDDHEAKKIYGENLFIAALAVVKEPGKIRVVHDGSNVVRVNHRIRPRDQTRSPGAGDLRRILRDRAAAGSKMFAIAGDISKAHRRIKIREQDWGFQACRLEHGKTWVNCVGTYGMGSAAYWWARSAAAMLIRLPHYLLGPDLLLELLLYVDDFLILARTGPQVEAAGFLIFVFVVLGVPFSWRYRA